MILRKIALGIISLLKGDEDKTKIASARKNTSREGGPDKVPLSGDAMTLDQVTYPEQESHVTFYTTENAEVAKGAEKSPAHGIDKFGEQDTFDPDEADEHQTNRDRNQNSDLNQRFYTRGMEP